MTQITPKTMNQQTNNSDKQNSPKRHFSIATKWLSLVALTISFAFLIFSGLVYSLVSSQLIAQEQETTRQTMNVIDDSLKNINADLTVSNVVMSLSPETKDLVLGRNKIEPEVHPSLFSDSRLSSLTRPDISLVVYNTEREIVFSTREVTDGFNVIETPSEKITTGANGNKKLTISHAVKSSESGKIVGYAIVENKLNDYNGVLKQLRSWMFIISMIAILITVLISYGIIRNILRPIKYMSRVAKEVDEIPDAQERIPKLDRNDELSDLATTFNQMLDRMQNYIEQQKRFVEDVSHELRTPVAVIEGHLNLLQRWGKDDPQVLEESINASVQEISRMKHLIQEMLDLTRAEQIEILYPDEVTKVDPLIKQVVGNLQLVHPDFKIQLDDDVRPESLVKIYRNHLEQILIILIDNAIKYSTDRKEIIVSAATDYQELRIFIQDFGEGVSAEEKDKIFNRFYRVDKARTREKGGNGLGLPIALKLIESYDGKISVDSVVGSGSTFKVTFPLFSENKY